MSPLLVEPVVLAPVVQGEQIVLVPVQNPEPPPGRGEEFGKASPVALVVIILLALVTVVLVRGMTKRIRRLPATFEQPSVTQGAGEDTAGKAGRDSGDAGPDPS